MWIYETLSKLQPNSQQEICRSSKKGRWVINCQQRTTCSTNSLFWLHWNPGWHCWCGVGHIASSWQPGIPRKLAFDVRNGIFWGLGPAHVGTSYARLIWYQIWALSISIHLLGWISIPNIVLQIKVGSFCTSHAFALARNESTLLSFGPGRQLQLSLLCRIIFQPNL